MRKSAISPAVEVVADAFLLRKAEPQLRALDVLDQVMRGRYGGRIEFGDLAIPPAPFAYLVAEALDGGMPRSDWEGLWRFKGNDKVRPFLLKVWAEEVWPKFVVRYSLY